jgi:Bacterial Ig-like domain (group 2)
MRRVRWNASLAWICALTIFTAAACSGSSPNNPVTPSPNPPGTPVTSLAVLVIPVLLGIGETGQARATSGTADVSTQTTWTSLNPSVASVTVSGGVTALASGSAQIHGQYRGASGDFPLEVISGADITEIILGGASTNVVLGQPIGLTPRLVIHGNTIYDLEANRALWSTSDPRVVAISPNGSLSTVSAGVANITVSYLGKTASIIVNVSVLDHDTFTIASQGASGLFAVGGKLSFSVTVAYSLLSAPGGRVALQILDQGGRALGSNPAVDVPGGLFKTATLTDEVTIPSGTTSICTTATMDLPTGQQLHASGACLTIR